MISISGITVAQLLCLQIAIFANLFVE